MENAISGKGVECKDCKDILHYRDELVYFMGDTQLDFVSEQYPDWTHAICITCADDKGLI